MRTTLFEKVKYGLILFVAVMVINLVIDLIAGKFQDLTYFNGILRKALINAVICAIATPFLMKKKEEVNHEE